MAVEGPEWLGHTLCGLALLLMELAAEEQDQMLKLPQYASGWDVSWAKGLC